MDALRGFVHGFRAGQDNNQPHQDGNGWFRTITDAAVDLYMPRGEDGERHMDRTLVSTTIGVVTTGYGLVSGACEGVSIYSRYNNDPDSVSQEEIQNYAYRMAAASGAFRVSQYLFQWALAERERQDNQQFLESMNRMVPREPAIKSPIIS